MVEGDVTSGPLPLICLPFAGAGASVFSNWTRYSSGRVEVLPLQLPGREKLLEVPAYQSVEEAVVGLFPEVHARLRGRDRVLLFGHSMGAVLAYELARRLLEEPSVRAIHLFVSGSPAPDGPRRRKVGGLKDDEFLKRICEFAGYSHPALEDPEMRELLLPTLRADVEMHESYVPRSKRPIPVAITSIRGRDDELVSHEDAAGWRDTTSGPFEVTEVEGSHMYLIHATDKVVRLIEDRAFVTAGNSER